MVWFVTTENHLLIEGLGVSEAGQFLTELGLMQVLKVDNSNQATVQKNVERRGFITEKKWDKISAIVVM